MKIHFYRNILFLAFFLTFVFNAFAQHKSPATHSEKYKAIDTPEEISKHIKHHLKDNHDFTFYTHPVYGPQGFPLPVILWTSKGLVAFMSSAFHHDENGHYIVSKSGLKFARIEGKIYELDANAEEVFFDKHHHPKNAHVVFLDFSITKTVIGILLVGILMLLLFGSLAKGYKKSPIPTGIGRFLEPLVLYVRDEIARPNIGEKKYRKYMGFLLTVFFFIFILNLLGLTPLGFNVTGNLTVTVCLALFTFFIVQFGGNKNYWKHIFWMPGVPIPMKILLMPIEILGMFTKPFSLFVRLYANITAGHFVLMSLIALIIILKSDFGTVTATGISMALSLFISIIELLVAFLQAFIFTMLSSLFIGMSVEDHEHH